ncbi:unnamed protein product, partial [Owenia fusiformis]
RTLQCSGYSIDVFVSLECGCKRCQPGMIGLMSGNSSFEPRVRLVGSVLDRSTKRPIAQTSVYYLGTNIANTSLSGRFYLKIPKGASRITVSVKDHFANAYFERTKVIHVNQPFGTIYEDIVMTKKSRDSVVAQSSTGIQNVKILGNDIEMSLDQLGFYSDGVKYNGSVGVSVNFIDPRDPNVDQLVPGDMVFTNEEGEVEDLRSFGMWQMAFDDTQGNDVGVQGDVGIQVSGNYLGATDRTPVKLWSMDPDSGRWQFENELRATESGIKDTHMMNTFFFGNITLRGNFVYNFDSPSVNYCFMRIETYTDPTLSNVTDWTRQRTPEARVVSAQSLRRDGSGMSLTGAESYIGGTKIKTNRNCILTTCSEEPGSSEFNGFVFVNGEEGPFSASHTVGGEAIPGAVIELDEQNRTIGTTVSPLTLDGPIYHSSQTECLNQLSS